MMKALLQKNTALSPFQSSQQKVPAKWTIQREYVQEPNPGDISIVLESFEFWPHPKGTVWFFQARAYIYDDSIISSFTSHEVMKDITVCTVFEHKSTTE